MLDVAAHRRSARVFSRWLFRLLLCVPLEKLDDMLLRNAELRAQHRRPFRVLAMLNEQTVASEQLVANKGCNTPHHVQTAVFDDRPTHRHLVVLREKEAIDLD